MLRSIALLLREGERMAGHAEISVVYSLLPATRKRPFVQGVWAGFEKGMSLTIEAKAERE
jgi:hypothetical protein